MKFTVVPAKEGCTAALENHITSYFPPRYHVDAVKALHVLGKRCESETNRMFSFDLEVYDGKTTMLLGKADPGNDRQANYLLVISPIIKVKEIL